MIRRRRRVANPDIEVTINPGHPLITATKGYIRLGESSKEAFSAA
jgi:hypothetical protein